ncbi:MAG: nucleotidyltransferase domain-containing protein [Patescibacteria group bacterium]
MTKQNELIIKTARPILRRYRVRKASLFGSRARNDHRLKSDVDILIDPPPRMSLIDLSGLKLDLEGALNLEVDVVIRRSLHPLLKPYIKEKIKIL